MALKSRFWALEDAGSSFIHRLFDQHMIIRSMIILLLFFIELLWVCIVKLLVRINIGVRLYYGEHIHIKIYGTLFEWLVDCQEIPLPPPLVLDVYFPVYNSLVLIFASVFLCLWVCIFYSLCHHQKTHFHWLCLVNIPYNCAVSRLFLWLALSVHISVGAKTLLHLFVSSNLWWDVYEVSALS